MVEIQNEVKPESPKKKRKSAAAVEKLKEEDITSGKLLIVCIKLLHDK